MDEIVAGIKSSLTITVRKPVANEFLATRRARCGHGELNKKRGRHTAKEKLPSSVVTLPTRDDAAAGHRGIVRSQTRRSDPP
jgi:hypothetical protein